MLLNIPKLCRLCLLQDRTMSSLFSNEENCNPTIADRIIACVQIEIYEGDELPQQICHKCLCKINKWYKFRELCKKTNIFLHQYVSRARVQQVAGKVTQVCSIKSELISKPTPDIMLLSISSELCRTAKDSKIIEDELQHKEESSSSLDSEDNHLQEHQNNHDSEHYFGTLAEVLLENNDPPRTWKPAAFNNKEYDDINNENKVRESGETASYKCCKGRHPCVVFHPEDRHKVASTDSEAFVNESILLSGNDSQNISSSDVMNCQQKIHNLNSDHDKTSGQQHDSNEVHSTNQTYTCHKCGNTYVIDLTLSFHVCHSSSTKCYLCNVCGSEFTTIKAMRCHAAYHTGKYQCNTCGNYFSAEIHRDVHMRKHTGEKPHVCTICSKTFMYSNSLMYHLNIHSGENSFICDICGHRSFSKGNFQRHKASHTKVKPHMCEICGKAFTVNVDLKRHRLTHSNDKNFTCDVCGKRFKTSAILSNHQRLHTGERPFSCDVCGKKFARNDGLKEHRLTHTGEKRHSCLLCGKQFAWSKGLKKHKCEPLNL
ncbi:zinc finger protein 235-like [Periplaneta americana]|uniref:zinc finger protein 235-like n=1 Tax=Periplaneta americana TaxID=6978 RepID=UPI0037E8987B